MLHDLLHRLRSLVRRRLVDAELEEELAFHRQQQLEKYRRAGLSADQARRRLALEFGGLAQTREACREARGVSVVEDALRDLRYGLRSLARTPAFSTVALLTLALGFGATTAIFSVVYGVLLRPLPYRDPSQLIVLDETTPKVGLVSVSYPNFADWRQRSRSFSDMALVCDTEVDLSGPSEPEKVEADAVTSNYFSMLGVRPLLGRDFTAAEDRPDAPSVVLLTHGLWQTHFAGDRAVVGRTVHLDGRPATIVGVLPASLRALDSVSLYRPIGSWLGSSPDTQDRGSRGDSTVLARLAPGVGLAQARRELEGIAAQLERAYPETNSQFGVELRPLRDVLVGDTRPALLALLATVVCVLLIACANVANLLLIRGAGRTREIALRMALGAGRRRLVSQLLVESTALATLGGVAGLALAVVATRALLRFVPADALGGAEVTVNGPVLAFAGAAVLVSTVVFGLTPALQAARTDVTKDLNEGGRAGGPGARQRRWHGALVVGEVSLALVLLVGAGLMMRSLSTLLSVDPGVRTDRVLTLSLGLRAERYAPEGAGNRFWTRLVEGVEALPGIESVALGTGVPLTGYHSRRDVSLEGMSFEEGALPHPDVHIVSPQYAATLRVPVLQGRMLTDDDRAGTQRVGLVNRRLAERYFGGADPVGRRFAFGSVSAADAPEWITIVGVLEDTRLYGLDNPSRLEVYLPLAQSETDEMTLLVGTGSDPESAIAAIRSVIGSIDRDQPIGAIATMADLRDASLATRQATFLLLALFSGLAVVLAAIGLYGVMSYAVAQRTSEFGIRLALGAQRSDLVRTIMARGLGMAVAGVGLGLVLALGPTRMARSLWFGVSTADPLTFSCVALGMIAVAALACAVPARRALRLDPQLALRR